MAISLCKEYLVDYGGEQGLLLSKDHDSYTDAMFMTSITDDGKSAVYISKARGQIKIRKVDFAQARPLEELKEDN